MNRLRELREEKGLTQKELGLKVNASQNTVSQWENGKRNIEMDLLVQFANLFDCTIDYIIGTSDQKQPQNSKENAISDIDRRIISGFSKLPNEIKIEILDFIAFKSSQIGKNHEELTKRK